MSLLFWTTPIVYPLSQIPPGVRGWLLASPMSPFVDAYHHIFYYGDLPSPQVWIAAAAYGIGTAILGFWWVLSLEERLWEQLG